MLKLLGETIHTFGDASSENELTWNVRGDIYILGGTRRFFCWIQLFGIGARVSRKLQRKWALM